MFWTGFKTVLAYRRTRHYTIYSRNSLGKLLYFALWHYGLWSFQAEGTKLENSTTHIAIFYTDKRLNLVSRNSFTLVV